MNIKHMLDALSVISDPDLFGLAQRRITVSTSGWTKGIKALAKTEMQYNLAVSLHGPDYKTRSKLIPSKNYNAEELLKLLMNVLDYNVEIEEFSVVENEKLLKKSKINEISKLID